MPELRLYNRRVESVFSLLGERENHITFSLGWALSQSPCFTQAFLRLILGRRIGGDLTGWLIHLQQFQKDAGITDIEIIGPGVHLIVEAKRGWELPSSQQLERYLPRLNKATTTRMIVTMSECSQAYADEYLAQKVRNVPVRHVSWSKMSSLSNLDRGSHAEKRLMVELRNYLATIVSMQNQHSNRVYVVSLGDQECAPGLTFKQVVNDRKRYFHPFGRSGWPKHPPNYIAFRYDGILQTIHHVESAEIFKNFHPHFPEYPDKDGEQYSLYELGPAIRPAHEIKAGKIVRNMRVWAMLDLLLTSKTISDARDKSKKRAELIP